MAPWQRVYNRPPGLRADIVAELRGIRNLAAHASISLLLDDHDKPDAAQHTLSAVYDDADMEIVEVYSLGDDAALSGILIAGRATDGVAILLVFLID